MSSRTGKAKSVARTRKQEYTQAYQYGNTVRKLQVAPKTYVTTKEDKPRLSNNTRKNREKALNMNFGYVMFLAVAVIVTLMVCIFFLNLQTEMTQKIKSISSLEKEVADLRSDNDETYNRITNSIDLEHIKEVALNEIGMVYASKDQVVLYDNEESDYVRQYSDIPKAKPSN